MVLLHLGIELTMNMHCFGLLSILGWMVFLVEPVAAVPAEEKKQPLSTSFAKKSPWKLALVDTIC